MAEEKETVTVFNKGHRTWTLLDYKGNQNPINPGESVVCEKAYGLRMAKSYPRDLTTSNPTTVIDNDALKRREQSVKDKEIALKAKEKELDEREKAIAEKVSAASVPEEKAKTSSKGGKKK